jgi:hypothetical protein
VLQRTYDDQVCSIARALEVVGERWSLLSVRDALLGLKRFEQFQDSLGIARNVLANRSADWSPPACSNGCPTSSAQNALSTGSPPWAVNCSFRC